MKSYQQLLSASAILAMSIPMAYAEEDEFDPFFEILLMGGISAVDVEDFTVQITEQETDKFVPKEEADWDSWTGQVGVGYVYLLSDEFYTDEIEWFPFINPQINLYYLQADDLSGDIHQHEMAEFDNLDYDMNFHSTRLMFDLGLTIVSLEHFSIYALGGLGVAWNDVDLDAIPNEQGEQCGINGFDLDSETSTSFAYEWGAGMTYAASDRVAISLEYLYAGITDVAIGESDEDDEFEIESSDIQVNTQSVLLGLRFAL